MCRLLKFCSTCHNYEKKNLLHLQNTNTWYMHISFFEKRVYIIGQMQICSTLKKRPEISYMFLVYPFQIIYVVPPLVVPPSQSERKLQIRTVVISPTLIKLYINLRDSSQILFFYKLIDVSRGISLIRYSTRGDDIRKSAHFTEIFLLVELKIFLN